MKTPHKHTSAAPIPLLPEWLTPSEIAKAIDHTGKQFTAADLTKARKNGLMASVKVGRRYLMSRRELETLRKKYDRYLRLVLIGDVKPADAAFLNSLTPRERAAPEKAFGKWLKFMFARALT